MLASTKALCQWYTHSNLHLTVQRRCLSSRCSPETLSAPLWNRQVYSSDTLKHCPDGSVEKKCNAIPFSPLQFLYSCPDDWSKQKKLFQYFGNRESFPIHRTTVSCIYDIELMTIRKYQALTKSTTKNFKWEVQDSNSTDQYMYIHYVIITSLSVYNLESLQLL